MVDMPRPTTLEPPPIDLGKETIGQRIAQAELANRMGIIQKLVSDYECDNIRPHPEMLARFAVTLELTTDELIGLKPRKTNDTITNRRLLRRLKDIQALPKKAQDTLIEVIDLALKNSGK